MSILKKTLKIILIVILCLLLIVIGYVAYYMLSYKRIADKLNLEVYQNQNNLILAGVNYNAMTYNIGFGAYTPDFGFFMDGGTEGQAKSEQSVKDTINGVINLVNDHSPDIMFIQEVDFDSTRSHKVDQIAMLREGFSGYGSIYAQNYDSPYLIYPFHSPLGANKSGQMLFTRFNMVTNVRRSLPVESGFAKYFDLDRCYTVTRIQVDNGKYLCLYSIHLSAYTSDGKIADEQLRLLVDDMKEQYQDGNYVICGGDYNKDLLGNSSEVFGVSGEDYTWAQPLKTEYLVDTGLSLVDSLDKSAPVPTSRNADGPYSEEQFVVSIDGFIVSDNVKVVSSKVVDTGFLYSDHNPVTLTFSLNA